MITLAQLTGADRRTYRRILHDPIVTNLRRERVRTLLDTLGDVTEIPGGGLRITRNGHVLALPRASASKTETSSALNNLRRFFKRSEIPPHHSNGREAHLLLVIAHHKARVFRSVIGGGVVEQLMSSADRDRFNQLNWGGKKLPQTSAAFEPIAQVLRVTGTILIFGESSSTQQDMDQFVIWLKQQHPELADRISGSIVLDHNQFTPGLLLAKARAYHANVRLYPMAD